jgi:hypothetical protein
VSVHSVHLAHQKYMVSPNAAMRPDDVNRCTIP